MRKLLLSVGIAAAILAGCNNSSSGGGITPVVSVTATPAPTTAPTASPVPTAVPTASPAPTAVPTASPAPTASPVPSAVPALTFYWTSSNLLSTAATSCSPAPTGAPANAQCVSPINLFAQGQFATVQILGGTAPYSGILNNCSVGGGVQASATLSQNPGLSSFTVTATNNSGACNVVITDSSNPTKTITIQEITTDTVTGVVS